VAWWNFCLVHNYAARFYHFTIQTIRETQLEMHRKFLSDIETIESSSTSGDEGGLVDQLTEFTVAQGDYAQQRWKELFFHLIVSFRDGYVITGQDTPSVTLTNSASPPSSHPLLPSPHLPLSSLSQCSTRAGGWKRQDISRLHRITIPTPSSSLPHLLKRPTLSLPLPSYLLLSPLWCVSQLDILSEAEGREGTREGSTL
jgi:hypothetical protein